MLKVEGLNVSYGEMQAVRDASFIVKEGEVVTVIGANGAGKTTTLKAIMGILKIGKGRVIFKGEEITNMPPWERVKMGIGLIPEGRRIFPELTVEENLLVGGYSRTNWKEVKRDLEEVYDLFPLLKERAGQVGKTLSGGEQQILAIGRALMGRPRLLLIDEISMGLMPFYVEKAFQIVSDLRKQGVTILLVEQNARKALQVADRCYLLETGRIVKAGSALEMQADSTVKRAYLGG